MLCSGSVYSAELCTCSVSSLPRKACALNRKQRWREWGTPGLHLGLGLLCGNSPRGGSFPRSSTSESRSTRPRAGLGGAMEYAYENGFPSFLPTLSPDPIHFPRRPLDLKVGVLLLRSSYDVVDDLDFIPMDKFQVKFWKLRQSELQPYTLLYQPLRIKYGDLTDPLYFDFISFSQYTTISAAMQAGELVFQEKLGASGEVQTVRRDSRLRSNADLPAVFKQRTGARIYQALVEGFEGADFGAPTPCPPGATSAEVLDAVSQLLRSLVAGGGFALSAAVTPLAAAAGPSGQGLVRFKVRVEGPANLWGVRALASRRAAVLNDFEAMAIQGLLQASQLVATYRSKYSDTYAEHVWTVG